MNEDAFAWKQVYFNNLFCFICLCLIHVHCSWQIILLCCAAPYAAFGFLLGTKVDDLIWHLCWPCSPCTGRQRHSLIVSVLKSVSAMEDVTWLSNFFWSPAFSLSKFWVLKAHPPLLSTKSMPISFSNCSFARFLLSLPSSVATRRALKPSEIRILVFGISFVSQMTITEIRPTN